MPSRRSPVDSRIQEGLADCSPENPGQFNIDDVDNIAVKNPKVDAELVAEAIKLSWALRAQGVPRRGYNLIPPFRRPMRVKEDAKL